ncbi:Uncharacterized protein TCM_046319 [Theobroma cacao]|uniref:Uncharacterized protein n=1 Tax=Theobroma cacao TaxID=3641 RepID=S1RWD4_THECC|nr:Uncharacterized protein TCM_046319 [Theobroma cacao]
MPPPAPSFAPPNKFNIPNKKERMVKAMEKSPTRRRMRMALRFRGTSAEVKRKSSRSIRTRSRNASSKIENWWTMVEDTTRFQLHSRGWVGKSRRKRRSSSI